MAKPSGNFDGGVFPANYKPSSITDLGGMIGKIAFQIIREVQAEDRLSVFDKKKVENGDTIEQAVVKLASGRAYDSTGANALSRVDMSGRIVAKYFKTWNRLTYDATIDIPEMRKVLCTGKGTEELSAKVVSSLSEGDKQEKYEYTKELLQWARQDKSGKVLKLVSTIPADAETGGIDYSAVLVALKDIVSGMQFVNDSFNTGSIKRKTLAEDIVILMPYKLKNRIDVEELAGVFNLSKAEIEKKIIEIDVDTETISSKATYPVYVVDRNAILNFTRLYEMVNQLNADGLFWNYFLHTERMYAISPLFDACYLLVQTE